MTGRSGFASHLRVYEPLAAFPEPDRTRWAGYAAASPPEADPTVGTAREHAAALAELARVPPRLVGAQLDPGAFVVVQDGSTYVCPWWTRLRSWEALAEFRRGLPDELADLFVPAAVTEAAERARARWQQAHPTARPAIRSCTWQVPIPWFALFEATERHLSLGPRPPSAGGAAAATGTGRALQYRTAMSRARQRLARARRVLRRSFEDGSPAVEGVEEIGRWLEDFHPHSLVELDYGGLVDLLDDRALAEDDSVDAVALALGHLARGDGPAAAAVYERLAVRWRSLAILENAN